MRSGNRQRRGTEVDGAGSPYSDLESIPNKTRVTAVEEEVGRRRPFKDNGDAAPRAVSEDGTQEFRRTF